MSKKTGVIIGFLALAALLFCLLPGCTPDEENGTADSGLEVGAVAAAHPLAVEVGQKILEEGGNAVDAAIGVSFALDVVEPYASGIGGGGFMLVFPAEGEPRFIDYREKAPLASHPDMFADLSPGEEIYGGLFAAVPGQLRGMEKAHEMFGSWDMADLMAPAIEMARDGIPVSAVFSSMLYDYFGRLTTCEELSEVYLHEGAFPMNEGELLKQENLAVTLSTLADEGFDYFYKGKLAEKIVGAVQDRGGIITLEDLESYRVEVLSPYEGSFGEYSVYTSCLPSSGGILLLQLLNAWDEYPDKVYGQPDSKEIAYLTKAMEHVFRDRELYIGDPAFVDVPVEWLTSEEYTEEMVKAILEDFPEIESPEQDWEGASTSSFVTADSEGSIVVVTQTIGYFFGSMVGAPGTGIIFNNMMNYFNTDPSAPNAAEGGKKPISSMAPTVFVKDGQPVLALGSPGSRRIITAICHVTLNYLERGFTLQEAVDAPRFHFANDYLYIEPGYPEEYLQELEDYNFTLRRYHDLDLYFGGVSAVGWYKDEPAAYYDIRREGHYFVK